MLSNIKGIFQIYILICFFAVGLLACGEAELTSIQHVERAKDFYDKDELRSAIIELKNALRKDGNNPEARYLIAKVYLDVGNGVFAEKEIRKAIDLGIDREVLLADLGRSLILQNKYKEVVESLDAMPGAAKSIPDAYYGMKGEAYLGLSNVDESSQQYKTLLQLQPASKTAKLGLARLDIVTRKFDDARDKLDELVKAYADDEKVWLYSGDLARQLAQWETAEKSYQNALKLVDKYDERMRYIVTVGYSKVLLAMGKSKQALELLDQTQIDTLELFALKGAVAYQNKDYSAAYDLISKVLQEKKNDLFSLLLMGAITFNRKEFLQAEDVLSRFLTIVPNHPQAVKLLAAVQMASNNPEAAKNILESTLKATDDQSLFGSLGQSAFLAGNFSESVKFFEKALKNEPDSSQLKTEFARSLMMENKSDKAFEQLKQVVEKDETYDQAKVTLIQGYMAEKKYNKALKMANRFIETNAQQPFPYSIKGSVLAESGDMIGAKEAFSSALKIKPGYAPAARSLARISLEAGDKSKAKFYYQEILKYEKFHLSSLISLAKIAELEKSEEEFENYLRIAIDGHPKEIAPRLMLVKHMLSSGKFDKAIGVSQEGLHHAESKPLLEVLGLAQLAANDYRNAELTFNRLLTLVPDSAEIAYYLSLTYKHMGDTQFQRTTLEKALAIDKNNINALVDIIDLDVVTNNLASAKNYLGRLKKSKHRKQYVTLMEAKIAMGEKDYKQAVELYGESLNKMPKSSVAAHGLIKANWLAGNKNKTLSLLSDWLDDHAADIKMQNFLGVVYEGLERPQDAIKAYEHALTVEPKNVMALNNVSNLLRERDIDKALLYSKRAHSFAPKSYAIKDTYGWILLHAGNKEKSLEILKQAHQLNGKNPEIKYHVAKALIANNKLTEAKPVLQEIIKMGGGYQQEAKIMLANIN